MSKTQMRFLIVLSVVLFLVVPIQATESIITEGINNTVTTESDTSSRQGSSSDGTYPKNYGSGGGGGFYRATPTPAIIDMPTTVTIEEPLQPEATSQTSPTPTETIPEVSGFSAWLAVVALFGLCVMMMHKKR